MKPHPQSLPLLIFTLSTLKLCTASDSYNELKSLLRQNNSESSTRTKLSRHMSSWLWQVDKLQQLEYGAECDSVAEEKGRHELTNLVAQLTQSSSPSFELFSKLEGKVGEILGARKLLCDYSRGLSCEEGTGTCGCYTGDRHGDIFYEPVREGGTCRLDEMSRCYSPSYLVSRGAVVIHCIRDARCVGDLSGRRCTSPLMAENCHCQRPCPDGSFTNLMDELKKCLAKLEQISGLQYNDTCNPNDQEERDQVVAVLEKSGSEKAGPIIRSIKRLLASNRSLCSPEDQLSCDPLTKTCNCGPPRDGILYTRSNGSCYWAKGSRCFPEDLYSNVTGSNGSCVAGTQCLLEGQVLPCDPAFEEPLCYCQDPEELQSSMGIVVGLFFLVLFVGGGGGMAWAVSAKIITCPPGSSPANV